MHSSMDSMSKDVLDMYAMLAVALWVQALSVHFAVLGHVSCVNHTSMCIAYLCLEYLSVLFMQGLCLSHPAWDKPPQTQKKQQQVPQKNTDTHTWRSCCTLSPRSCITNLAEVCGIWMW